MVTDNKLKASSDYGWTAGFRNMLRKENARWWNLKSIAVQLVVWLVILNSFVAIVLFIAPGIVNNLASNQSSGPGVRLSTAISTYSSPQKIADKAVSTFFQIAGFAVFVGAIIFGHDALLKERESGTAAWLLSKPLSRKAFVLSKVLAIGVGVTVIILLVQGVIAYALCSYEVGSPMPVLPFLEGLGVLWLVILFYLTLAIALGAFTLSRGIALGIPLIIGIIGGLILSILQSINFLTQLGYIVPWNMTSYASSLATGASLASDGYWPWPVLATAICILLFIGATLVKFDKLEL
jgi:ABC-2 type transport system permease protein